MDLFGILLNYGLAGIVIYLFFILISQKIEKLSNHISELSSKLDVLNTKFDVLIDLIRNRESEKKN
ncbi:MAG: hypothetical protein QW607_06120 [Desulfurococcaceae archaeon]